MVWIRCDCCSKWSRFSERLKKRLPATAVHFQLSCLFTEHESGIEILKSPSICFFFANCKLRTFFPVNVWFWFGFHGERRQKRHIVKLTILRHVPTLPSKDIHTNTKSMTKLCLKPSVFENGDRKSETEKKKRHASSVVVEEWRACVIFELLQTRTDVQKEGTSAEHRPVALALDGNLWNDVSVQGFLHGHFLKQQTQVRVGVSPGLLDVTPSN